MKALFEIEWKDELGEGWMNRNNLAMCLITNNHCGEGAILNVSQGTVSSFEEMNDLIVDAARIPEER